MLRLITPKIHSSSQLAKRSVLLLKPANPLKLFPGKKWGVDLVIEATGVFIDKDGASKHIQLGAKKS